MKIFYIEDEPSLAKIVKESLELRNFEVYHLLDGSEMMTHFQDFAPDLCLFDVMLPIKDGFTLAKEIRALDPKIPIIFMTAMVQTEDVLKGFGSGGNDYIKKPFSLEELIVRINNIYQLSRGTQRDAVISEDHKLGAYQLNVVSLELVHPLETKRISYRELQLLMMLIQSQHDSVTRKDILLTIWGDDSFFNSRTLDVYVTKLRGYLKHDPNIEIITLKGLGYRLVVKS
jgi:DNA-binding response OmpR family regulator